MTTSEKVFKRKYLSANIDLIFSIYGHAKLQKQWSNQRHVSSDYLSLRIVQRIHTSILRQIIQLGLSWRAFSSL